MNPFGESPETPDTSLHPARGVELGRGPGHLPCPHQPCRTVPKTVPQPKAEGQPSCSPFSRQAQDSSRGVRSQEGAGDAAVGSGPAAWGPAGAQRSPRKPQSPRTPLGCRGNPARTPCQALSTPGLRNSPNPYGPRRPRGAVLGKTLVFKPGPANKCPSPQCGCGDPVSFLVRGARWRCCLAGEEPGPADIPQLSVFFLISNVNIFSILY